MPGRSRRAGLALLWFLASCGPNPDSGPCGLMGGPFPDDTISLGGCLAQPDGGPLLEVIGAPRGACTNRLQRGRLSWSPELGNAAFIPSAFDSTLPTARYLPGGAGCDWSDVGLVASVAGNSSPAMSITFAPTDAGSRTWRCALESDAGLLCAEAP